jgi:signal peptidase I
MRQCGDVTLPLTVPKGCVFVMGDNRNDSLDSRYSSVGCVDVRNILGKAVLRIFPFSEFGAL